MSDEHIPPQKNRAVVIEFPPMENIPHSNPWYIWAINTYHRRFVSAEEITVVLLDELHKEFSHKSLIAAYGAGCRYERTTGIFIHPTYADQWTGVPVAESAR